MGIFKFFYRILTFVLIVSFMGTSVYVPNVQAGELVIPAMPEPGRMVNLSRAFTPAHLQGLTINPTNALQFDFLVRKSDSSLNSDQKKLEYSKLVKYFLASLTVADKDQWVNLSPYEKDRIIEDNFGKTDMGRDLLAQDYLLKQITSSLMYPESGLGKSFWNKVYAELYKRYGTTSAEGGSTYGGNIPVNTFNKVWIVPDKADVYESGDTVYILNSHLKVMLEQDYVSLNKHRAIAGTAKQSSTAASNVIRDVILPAIEKEVNEGKNFASLRQIYSAMILATWYKKALKESLLGKIYADKAKVSGIKQPACGQAGIPCAANEAIYRQYIAAFKKGVYNYIKEEQDTPTGQMIPRKYFAGGFDRVALAERMTVYTSPHLPDRVQVGALVMDVSAIDSASVSLAEEDDAMVDSAMDSIDPPDVLPLSGLVTYLGQMAQLVQQYKATAGLRLNPVSEKLMRSPEISSGGLVRKYLKEKGNFIPGSNLPTYELSFGSQNHEHVYLQADGEDLMVAYIIAEKGRRTLYPVRYSSAVRGFYPVMEMVFQAIPRDRAMTGRVEDRALGRTLDGDAVVASTSSTLTSSMAEKMVQLSEGSGTWDQLKSQWSIERLVYSPGGIQNSGLTNSAGEPAVADEFGNRPFWVYFVRNTRNNHLVYAGPNDVASLFPERREEVDALRRAKEEQKRDRVDVLARIGVLKQLFGGDPISPGVAQLLSELASHERPALTLVGDRHFGAIDTVYAGYASLWSARYNAQISLENFLEIRDDLIGAVRKSRRWGRISYLSHEIQEHVKRILMEQQGTLTRQDVDVLLLVHRSVVDVKNSILAEAAAWASKRSKRVHQENGARRAAFHANIWVANWLAKKFENAQPVILDVGANHSVLWSMLNRIAPSLAHGVIDLEYEGDIFQTAPNPHRIHASIADLDDHHVPKVMASSDDVARDFVTAPHTIDVITTNFMLDQLGPGQIKEALKGFETMLGEKNAFLVITSPEHSPLNNIEKVLVESGYAVVSQGANMSNFLSEGARERIGQQPDGQAHLALINSLLTQKVYHVGVYEKVRHVSMEEIDRIDASRLEIRQGGSRKSTAGEGETGSSSWAKRFTAEDVDMLDILGEVNEQDFEVRSLGAIVTKDELAELPAYERFEESLAALLWFKAVMDAQGGAFVRITRLLGPAQDISEVFSGPAAYLPADSVEFVLNAMTRRELGLTFAQIEQVLPELAPSLRAMRTQEERRLVDELHAQNGALTDRAYASGVAAIERNLATRIYNLRELYDLENRLRGNNGLQMPRDEVMPAQAAPVEPHLEEMEGAHIPGQEEASRKPTPTPDELSRIMVNEFFHNMGVKTANALSNDGLLNVPMVELLAKTESELLRVPGFGPKSLAELNEELREYGLHFAVDPEAPPPARISMHEAQTMTVRALLENEMDHRYVVALQQSNLWDVPIIDLLRVRESHLRRIPYFKAAGFLKLFALMQAHGLVGESWDMPSRPTPTPEELAHTTVNDFFSRMSVRTANALKNDHLLDAPMTVLLAKTEAELLRTPNFGPKSLKELTDELSEHGLRFGGDRVQGRLTEDQLQTVHLNEIIPVEHIGVRLYNVLRNENLLDVPIARLLEKTERDFLRIPNFGRDSLRELKELLAGFDVRLGQLHVSQLKGPWTREQLSAVTIEDLFAGDTLPPGLYPIRLVFVLRIVGLTEEELAREYRLSPKSVTDVKARLAKRGLTLGVMPDQASIATPGGIDLSSANLTLHIKRDGKGLPLPFAGQDMTQLSRIQGFVPRILEIRPAASLPILSELKQRLQAQPAVLAGAS